uniref:Uncharacterized protein n=1 Tax=Anopheles merus TaxID=30066 RepID=A0A182VBN8_ANOME
MLTTAVHSSATETQVLATTPRPLVPQESVIHEVTDEANLPAITDDDSISSTSAIPPGLDQESPAVALTTPDVDRAKAFPHFLRQHDSAKGKHKTGTQQGSHRNSDYPSIHDVSEQPPINRFLLRSHGMMRMLTAIDCRWPCPESGDFGDTLVLLRRSNGLPSLATRESGRFARRGLPFDDESPSESPTNSGNENSPARRGFFAFRMNLRIIQNNSTLTKPLSTGEMNHEPTIVSSVFHLSPCVPRATRLKPIVDPTMLCVPEMGILRNVATSSHSAELPRADRQPSISSISLPLYISTSRIPFRIVSDTL